MLMKNTRPTTGFLTVAALAAGFAVTPGVLAQVAGSAQGVSEVAPAVLPLDKAAALLQEGKPVQAKAMIGQLLRPGVAESLSESERDRAILLNHTADEQTRALSAVECSLQKAEWSVVDGDLRFAERQATAVLNRANTSEEDRARAREVLDEVSQRRAEIAPLIGGLIDDAVREFNTGEYSQAKATLTSVSRSGVPLSGAQERVVDQYQMKIIEIERQQGSLIDADSHLAVLGMLQPGTVRRGGGQTAPTPAQPPAPSEPQPAPSQPGVWSETDQSPQSQPPAQPQPQAAPQQPAPQPQPTFQPAGQEDLIQAALRADAQRIFAEAEMAFTEKRYNDAIRSYTLSSTVNRQYLSPDQIAQAESRLAEARELAGRNAPQNIVGPTQANIKIRRERTQATFDNEIDQASKALAAGDTAKARELTARARLTARSNAEVFSEAENQTFSQRVDEMSQRIETEAEQIRIKEANASEAMLKKQQEEAAATSRANKEKKISESIDRIRALQAEQKYAEALQVVDQVLFLDPNNPSALLLRDALADIIVYKDFWEVRRKAARIAGKNQVQNFKEMLPPKDIVDYPEDWPSRSFQRGELAAYAESPEDRRVLATLNAKKIPVDFNDNTLSDVLSFIETVSQVNIDVDWESLQQVGINKESLVSLKLTNVSLRVALDRVLEKASRDQFSKAGWTVTDGILRIASDESLRKQTVLVPYNVTDLLLEIPNYYDAPQIDLQGVLQQSQGGGGGQSPFRDDQQQQRNPEEQERRRRDRITQIMDIIRQNVDYEGWRENGGETGAIQELNGTLIIRNTPRNHREIMGLLSKLREIRSMQINVETKFLLVNQDWFEQIGFDIDVIFNAGSNQVTAAQAVDPTIQPIDFFSFNGANKGVQRNVTGQNPVTGTTAPPINITQGVVPPQRWSPIGALQDSLGLTNGIAASSVRDDSLTAAVLGAAPALGIAGQFLDDVQVDFLVVATQADRRSVQLTAPRLTFTNGQTANIFVVTQQAFVSDLTPIVGDSAVGFDPTVSVASEGVTMLVEGVISSDRRYVTMNIDAGVSRIDGFGQQAVTAVAGGQLVNSADTQSFIQLPTVTVTRVRTTASVPDEGTVLLGGQRLVTEIEIETGVPVLSKIPIINRFFTNSITSREEQTLLILVKPTIMIQSEQEEKNFPGLGDAMRTGLGIQ
ncbi:MAG: hypothetical protein KF745_06220 [Phycisphaeraceae bacterium]|nr:hypothetical protein [Phycisphaeraceae bacterium]